MNLRRTTVQSPTLTLTTMYAWRIWWSLLPLIILCGFLGLRHINHLREMADQNASAIAHNAMAAVDQHIESQFSGLQMLADSPLVENSDHWEQFYQEALGFHRSFGNHVILADLGMQMRLNTRVPFGDPLPLLPRPSGHVAAQIALETGRPAAGDMFIGPVIHQPLVALAVPIIRQGQTRYLLLCTIETAHFSEHFNSIILPEGNSIRLIDGNNAVLAEQSQGKESTPQDTKHQPRRHVVHSSKAPWSVELAMAPGVYQRSVVVAALELLMAVGLTVLLSFTIGRLTSRRLRSALATLAHPEKQKDKPQRLIQEIETLRQDLAHSINAQATAEINLQNVEARFRNLFEVTAIPLCFVDQNGAILEFNRSFTETFGYDHTDLPSLSEWWELAYPDPVYRQWVLATWEQAVQHAAATKSTIEPIEYQVTCKNGEIRSVIVSGSILNDCFLATFFDISARKQVEKQLSDSESLFRNLFQHHSAIKLVIDPTSGSIVDANKAAVQFYGWPLDELKTMRIQQINNLSQEEIVKRINQVQNREQNYFEFKHYLADGSVRDVEVYSSPIVVQGRQLLHSIVHDISERKKKEAERERLLAAIEQAGESIFITDAQGIIQYTNPAFETITGYSRSEVLGKNPRLLKSGIHDRVFYRDMWQTIILGNTWKGRVINRRKDGSEYTEETTISPVRDTTGKIVNFVAVKRDISDSLQLEAQLQQAQKMESIGRLAGGVAHDYNNMLSVILGYSQMALEKVPAGSPLQRELSMITDAANRSVQITRQLLAFARKQAILPKVLDLNETVEGMLKMMRRLLGENIELAWFPDTNAWPVKIDPSQLDQILANLCVNARDAISGTGRISLETRRATLDASFCREHPGCSPGEYTLLAVSDTGCGMDRQTLDKIFEPFFTTKKVGEGTGLGLSTVYGIVKQNSCFIDVTSELGKGSTFFIYFPRHTGGENTGKSKTNQQVPQGHGQWILLVEDDPGMLELTRTILTSLNYQVEAKQSPVEAFEVGSSPDSPFSLLITDVIMPEMNGRELAEQLQKKQPTLPCLFMSGYTADVIAQSGILDDRVHFLQKPFSKETLAVKINKILNQSL